MTLSFLARAALILVVVGVSSACRPTQLPADVAGAAAQPASSTAGDASPAATATAPLPADGRNGGIRFASSVAAKGARMAAVASVTRLTPIAASASRSAFDLSAHCNLDRVGTGVPGSGRELGAAPVDVSKAEPALFSGWLVDPRRGTTGSDLRLVVEGVEGMADTWTSGVVVRKANPGALAARGYQAAMLESSFGFLVDMTEVKPGTYHVYVVFDETSGGALCDPGRRIRITG